MTSLRRAERHDERQQQLSTLEREAITALSACSSPGSDGSGRLRFLQPSASELEQVIASVVDVAQEGAVLLRTPAQTATQWALKLFEHHQGLCFWATHGTNEAPVMYTYFGEDLWDFARVFSAGGAVFLRGRGTIGPWTARSTHVRNTELQVGATWSAACGG